MRNEFLSIVGVGTLIILVYFIIIKAVNFAISIHGLFEDVEFLKEAKRERLLHVGGTTITAVNERIDNLEKEFRILESKKGKRK